MGGGGVLKYKSSRSEQSGQIEVVKMGHTDGGKKTSRPT